MDPLGQGSLQMDRGMVPLVLFGQDSMLKLRTNLSAIAWHNSSLSGTNQNLGGALIIKLTKRTSPLYGCSRTCCRSVGIDTHCSYRKRLRLYWSGLAALVDLLRKTISVIVSFQKKYSMILPTKLTLRMYLSNSRPEGAGRSSVQSSRALGPHLSRIILWSAWAIA